MVPTQFWPRRITAAFMPNMAMVMRCPRIITTSTDHDHVSVVLLNDPGMDANPDPQRTLRRDIIAADGTIRDGPRRPPRLMMA